MNKINKVEIEEYLENKLEVEDTVKRNNLVQTVIKGRLRGVDVLPFIDKDACIEYVESLIVNMHRMKIRSVV